jgi:hypothetical protein
MAKKKFASKSTSAVRKMQTSAIVYQDTPSGKYQKSAQTGHLLTPQYVSLTHWSPPTSLPAARPDVQTDATREYLAR